MRGGGVKGAADRAANGSCSPTPPCHRGWSHEKTQCKRLFRKPLRCYVPAVRASINDAPWPCRGHTWILTGTWQTGINSERPGLSSGPVLNAQHLSFFKGFLQELIGDHSELLGLDVESAELHALHCQTLGRLGSCGLREAMQVWTSSNSCFQAGCRSCSPTVSLGLCMVYVES